MFNTPKLISAKHKIDKLKEKYSRKLSISENEFEDSYSSLVTPILKSSNKGGYSSRQDYDNITEDSEVHKSDTQESLPNSYKSEIIQTSLINTAEEECKESSYLKHNFDQKLPNNTTLQKNEILSDISNQFEHIHFFPSKSDSQISNVSSVNSISSLSHQSMTTLSKGDDVNNSLLDGSHQLMNVSLPVKYGHITNSISDEYEESLSTLSSIEEQINHGTSTFASEYDKNDHDTSCPQEGSFNTVSKCEFEDKGVLLSKDELPKSESRRVSMSASNEKSFNTLLSIPENLHKTKGPVYVNTSYPQQEPLDDAMPDKIVEFNSGLHFKDEALSDNPKNNRQKTISSEVHQMAFCDDADPNQPFSQYSSRTKPTSSDKVLSVSIDMAHFNVTKRNKNLEKIKKTMYYRENELKKKPFVRIYDTNDSFKSKTFDNLTKISETERPMLKSCKLIKYADRNKDEFEALLQKANNFISTFNSKQTYAWKYEAGK